MRRDNAALWALYEKRRALDKRRQSVEHELEITLLDWEIKAAEAKRDIECARTATILLKAWMDHGSMRIRFLNGEEVEGHPHNPGNSINYFWNARREAQRLAQMKWEWDEPVPLRLNCDDNGATMHMPAAR